MTRKTKILVAVAAVAVVMMSAVTVALLARSRSTHEPLAFRVDPSVRPSVAQVAAVEGGTGFRPVGALARPDGTVAEMVLDEVIVHVKDDAELAAFLGRWNGQVLDSFPADTDGQDHLVRVDTSRADPSSLPRDLLAVEPEQTGEHRASDERVVRLLALAAAEWRRDTEVVVDWLIEPMSIETGEAYEASDITEGGKPKNVFDWSFMRSGGAMDTGVGAAWQLLQAHGKLKPQVKYMVVDGGFTPSPDLPKNSKIRKAEWGDKNPKDCTNGASCPYHGTDVALAAMAIVDSSSPSATASTTGPSCGASKELPKRRSPTWSTSASLATSTSAPHTPRPGLTGACDTSATLAR
jgi:serine protease